jgi:hypothetical protein
MADAQKVLLAKVKDQNAHFFLNCVICEKYVQEGKAVNIESSIVY